ncbi:MAG: VanZ family protein [Prevotellaceae bacterium]|jgi:VanZ family protein|nr:VanZ family protein [Prevotellaceae bacterium]
MMLRILKYHWRAILWIAVIVFACLTPGEKLPGVSFFDKIPFFDKIVHFAMYFIFALFLMSGFSRQYGKTSTKAYIFSFIPAFLLGVLIEFIQEKVGRSYDIYDMTANTVGIIVSLLLFNPIKWILRNIL